MAAAGFYHCPTDTEPDLVKCFVCQKELDGWEPDDDPRQVKWESYSQRLVFLPSYSVQGLSRKRSTLDVALIYVFLLCVHTLYTFKNIKKLYFFKL